MQVKRIAEFEYVFLQKKSNISNYSCIKSLVIKLQRLYLTSTANFKRLVFSLRDIITIRNILVSA